MITLDKVKLVANINAILNFDETQFEKIVKFGSTTYKFYQEIPYLLAIKVDYSERELVIEFTGKVLGRDYPKLISLDTIRQCFEIINTTGVITLDIEAMMDAEVVKCDVTKDIQFDDIASLTKYIRNHTSSYQRFVCRKLRNNNLVIEKNVVTRKTKKRMTIYNKGKEMEKADNRRFVETYGLQNAFDGICRFELNLNSKEQIRNAISIGNTKLQNVLSSDANPIVDFLDEVIDNDTQAPAGMTGKKAYFTELVLRDCDFDLEKVEAKMRQLYTSKGTSITNIMKPYRQMMEQQNLQEGVGLWTDVRRKLTS